MNRNTRQKEFLSNKEYILVNATDKVVNGPYTRYETNDPENEDKKSVLDLVIVSKSLYEYVEKVEIDKDLKWTPCRPSKKSVKYSDHYAVLVTFRNIPRKKKKRRIREKAPKIWNIIKMEDGKNMRPNQMTTKLWMEWVDLMKMWMK